MENDGDAVVCRSHVRIERVAGAFRRAWLPARDEAVELGVHGAVAEHYGVQDEVAGWVITRHPGTRPRQETE